MIDPYKVLSVDYEASDGEVKRAYHMLAKKYHPDNYADDAKEAERAGARMSEINAAYEQILSDRERGIRGPSAYAAAKPAPSQESAQSERTSKAGKAAPRQRYRKRGEEIPREFVGFVGVREMINGGLYPAALGELFRVPEKLRGAEWHHLASLAHLGCRHLHDAFREADLACRADKKNTEYRRMREEMRRGTAGFAKASRSEQPKGRHRVLRFLWKRLLRTLGLDD